MTASSFLQSLARREQARLDALADLAAPCGAQRRQRLRRRFLRRSGAERRLRRVLEISRWLVVYLRRPGGQSQFSAPLAAQVAEREGIRKLLLWMSENMQADLSVAARQHERANICTRVRGGDALTPAAYVERLRVDAARRSLESSKKSIKQIARLCGFGTVETLHRAFRRGVGSTPLQYRARFATPRLSG